MRLRPNEFCPDSQINVVLWAGTHAQTQADQTWVQRIEDPHHPRGYRALRSPAEMRKLLNRKIESRTTNAPSATKNSRIITIS